jgi:hypothetical protein
MRLKNLIRFAYCAIPTDILSHAGTNGRAQPFSGGLLRLQAANHLKNMGLLRFNYRQPKPVQSRADCSSCPDTQNSPLSTSHPRRKVDIRDPEPGSRDQRLGLLALLTRLSFIGCVQARKYVVEVTLLDLCANIIHH